LATILCLETATTNCSVGLSFDGKLISIKEDNTKGYSHAEKLHLFIQEVLKEAGKTLQDLDAIAVSKGPGSYTGLRIGVSAAKGLCFSLQLPLIAIPTLDLLVHQLKGKPGLKVAMMDARRMEVYAAVYNQDLEQLEKTSAVILDEGSFAGLLKESKVHFIGNGVAKFSEIISSENAIFHEKKFPSALEMAEIAEMKYKKSDTEDVAYFEPYYLKEFRIG